MNTLPLPIYSLIAKHLEFRDDWLSFLVTCKRIQRGLLEYPSRPALDIYLKNNYPIYNMSWKGEYTEGWTSVRGSCINFTEKTKCRFLYRDDDFENEYEFIEYEFTEKDKTPFSSRCTDTVTVYRSVNPADAVSELRSPLSSNGSFIFENTNTDEEGTATYISFPNKEIVLKIIAELRHVQKIADENGKTLEWF